MENIDSIMNKVEKMIDRGKKYITTHSTEKGEPYKSRSKIEKRHTNVIKINYHI